jgi:hypothetical protein
VSVILLVGLLGVTWLQLHMARRWVTYQL